MCTQTAKLALLESLTQAVEGSDDPAQYSQVLEQLQRIFEADTGELDQNSTDSPGQLSPIEGATAYPVTPQHTP